MKKFILGVFFGALVSVTTTVIAGSVVSFPDVSTDDWFYDDVNSMVEWGVITGHDDGTFKPEDGVNRAELSAMWNRYEDHLEEKFALKGEESPSAPPVDIGVSPDLEDRVVELEKVSFGDANNDSMFLVLMDNIGLIQDYSVDRDNALAQSIIDSQTLLTDFVMESIDAHILNSGYYPAYYYEEPTTYVVEDEPSGTIDCSDLKSQGYAAGYQDSSVWTDYLASVGC